MALAYECLTGFAELDRLEDNREALSEWFDDVLADDGKREELIEAMIDILFARHNAREAGVTLSENYYTRLGRFFASAIIEADRRMTESQR